ncbi:het domain protein [Colletotrichum kahawae]|uniref:Het domain protein n=1 Tax=Colletotrichum kahawae TaxID=34407 RepID=A0AAE0D968_COLKA|nr:het domain protein [Colletotrichum kahawae]
MDYLPYPVNSVLPPITVPYLPGYEIDNGDYRTFPERVGRTVRSYKATRDDASLLQEWLFFGLIDQINNQSCNRSCFVRSGRINGECCDVIDASPLTPMLESLTIRLRGRRGSHATEKISSRLGHAAAVCKGFRLISDGEESILAVYLSIAILVEFLASYLSQVIIPEDLRSCFLLGNPHRLGPDAGSATGHYSGNNCPAVPSLLMKRLVANGCCKHQVLGLECYNSYMVTYYLSSIRKKEPKGISHNRCTASTCEAYNTNENYKTRHTSDEFGCIFQQVDENAVVRILAGNGIPLVSMHEDDNGNIKMEVVPITAELQYTAISHVWIDGLGNNEGNALPDCQLRRLFQELKMHQSPAQASVEYLNLVPSKRTCVKFWMDTLCVPVRAEHAHLRMRAINQMALVYSAAQATLVLDEELRLSEEQYEGREGLLARCLTSKWNTRCWTLQEGMLARRCLFQFRDCAVSISREPKFTVCLPHQHFDWVGALLRAFPARYLYDKGYRSLADGWWGTNCNIAQKVLCYELQHACNKQARANSEGLGIRYSHTRLREDKAVKHFFSMWTTLAKRSTTKTEDLHVILANLTDFKSSEIQKIPLLQDRTKVMLQNLDHFPLRLMYDDGYRPLAGADHPDRWIPSGPIHKEVATIFDPRHEIMVEPTIGIDGLMLMSELKDKQVYRIQTRGMSAKEFDVVIPEEEHFVVYHLDRKICSGDKLNRSGYQVMFLIFDADYGQRGGALFLSKDKYREEEHRGKVLQLAVCRFDCPVSIYRMRTLVEPPEDIGSPVLRGEALPDTVHLAVECCKL